MNHADAAKDRRLLDAPDEWEEAQERLADLNAAMGVCATGGWLTSFYLLLPDAAKLSMKLDGGKDDGTIQESS